MINGKPVISCYLLQYGISPSFHIFSWFLSLKGSSNITAKQTQKCNRSSGSIIEAVLLVWPSYVSGITALGLQIPILGLWGWGRSQKLWVLGSVYQDEDLNCFKAIGTTIRRKIAFNGTHLRFFKTDFFSENLTTAFKSPYIAKSEKTTLFSCDFNCSCYSLYFFNDANKFLMANTCVYTIYLKRDQKNYIKLHCIEFEQVFNHRF